jgi:hypothetical protein
MNVRDIRMAFRIAEIALLCKTLVTLALVSLTLVTLALFRLALFGGALLHLSLPLLRSPLLRSSLPSSRRRAVRWNISATDATLIPVLLSPAPLPTIPFLRKARNRNAQGEQGQKYYIFLHHCLQFDRRSPAADYLKHLESFC